MSNEDKDQRVTIYDKGTTKIVRGTYLTGIGQENRTFYFKIRTDHVDYEKVQDGKVCVTFYQQDNLVTSIPALIRVGRVLTNEPPIQEALKLEQRKGYPMLPIVKVVEKFDVLAFMSLIDEFSRYQEEISILQNSINKRKKGKNPNEESRYQQVNLF